jgi:hypothetical protein
MRGGADGSGAPRGSKNGNYKHGRYTQDVAATRQRLREATHMLCKLNNRALLTETKDANFKMTQNFKVPDPKETGGLNKADICRALYHAAEFHLFGAGSWPADREASAAFWQMRDDLELTTVVSDGKPGTIQYTPLGLELNVELMSIFTGAVGLWDIPLLLDLMGHLDDEEAEAIDESISRHPEHVIRRLVRRVYFKFCNQSKFLN